MHSTALCHFPYFFSVFFCGFKVQRAAVASCLSQPGSENFDLLVKVAERWTFGIEISAIKVSVNLIRPPRHTFSSIHIFCLPFKLLLITWAVNLLKGPPPCETDETRHDKLSSSVMGCNLTGPSKIHPTYTSDSFPLKALTSFLKVKLVFGAAGPLRDCTPVLAPQTHTVLFQFHTSP